METEINSSGLWYYVTGVENETSRVNVQDHTGYELPDSVDPTELRVKLGTRLRPTKP